MNINFIRRFYLPAIFLLLFTFCNAQENNNTTNNNIRNTSKSKFFTGGSLGLQFGTVTLIDISPILGYMVTDNIAVGVGFTYKYYKYKDINYDFTTNIYGGSIFSRYYINDNFFAHVEYELLNYELDLVNPWGDGGRINVESFLIGGGYRQLIGGNSFMSILILYNLNESIYSLYSNPIIRIGFGVGL